MSDLQSRKDAEPALVLRVVGGRLAGKEYPLARGARLCVGHALANDVVLRGAGTRDGAVELRIGEDATASLRVLSGRVELLGRELGEGEEAVLPAYLPFRFGEFVIAHGTRASDRWDEAAAIANGKVAAPVAPLPAPQLADRLLDAGRRHVAQFKERGAIFPLAAASGALLFLAAAAGPASELIEQHWGSADRLDSYLASSGFRDVDVTRSPAGDLVVTGMVADEAALGRLRSLVASRSQPVTLDVSSAAALATSATDILQAQGVDATAQPAGLGGIAVVAPYQPADRQEQLRQLLMRDLPGLRRVTFRIDDSRGGSPLQAYFANSGAGIASVVEDPAHIQTADGSRWFPGAILPTGHRLIAIEAGKVRFEKDGRIEEIQL